LNKKSAEIDNLQTENQGLKGNITSLKEKFNNLEALYNSIYDTKESKLRNPTWTELKTFLENDNTNKLIYSDSFDCSGFSTELFKRARDYGFRVAIVEIEFEKNETGHALNAFQTTDKGLIYVDNTGNEKGTEKDKIAYVKTGDTFGTIDLDALNEKRISCDNCLQFMNNLTYKTYQNVFDYSYFVNSAKCNKFRIECVETYNKAVSDFNAGDRKYTYNQIQTWYNNIEKLNTELGGKYYNTVEWNDKVKSVEIYW
jgi:hypothetical protein